MFDCLSVFSGSFDIEAVGAVIVDDAGAALEDVVASLVAKSMLTVQHTASGTRFQQLETLRQFGEERLEHRGLAGRADPVPPRRL